MKERVLKNNNVEIAGTIISEFEFNHEVFGEKFYRFFIENKRKSGNVDTIPVIISEKLVDVEDDCLGEVVKVIGQYRSCNVQEYERRKLQLNVFTNKLSECDDKESEVNRVELEGFICKAPIYRTTPLGREICDLFVAVNRAYGKSDYIPCVVWGRNAVFASKLRVGDCVNIVGRIQSRPYEKKIGDVIEDRIAYEVSGNKVTLKKKANDNE